MCKGTVAPSTADRSVMLSRRADDHNGSERASGEGLYPPGSRAVSDSASDRSSGSNSSDHRVSGRTFMFQAQLPKLEVPSLEDTLRRYLDAVEPLLSSQAFETTKALVDEVGNKKDIDDEIFIILARVPHKRPFHVRDASHALLWSHPVPGSPRAVYQGLNSCRVHS